MPYFSHLVAVLGVAIHGLGHVHVVVALAVGAAVLAVGAEGGHPRTARVLVLYFTQG